MSFSYVISLELRIWNPFSYGKNEPTLTPVQTTVPTSPFYHVEGITLVSFFSEIHLNLNSVHDGHRYPLILVLNRLNSNGLNKWSKSSNLNRLTDIKIDYRIEWKTAL